MSHPVYLNFSCFKSLFKTFIKDLSYNLKHTSLINKIAKENNLTINKLSNNFYGTILVNNLRNTLPDIEKTVSVVISSILSIIKIQGGDVSSICKTMSEPSDEFKEGYLLKRYVHDKGYRYLKSIKFYNLEKDYFELDLSDINIRMVDIQKIYYQEYFDIIIIVGKKLTYGEIINNSYVIKVFSSNHNMCDYFEIAETSTSYYRKDNGVYWEESLQFLNNYTCIDTIDVSQLKELDNVKYVDIGIGSDGIEIVEKHTPSFEEYKLYDDNDNEVHLNKKFINIRYNYYNHKERIVEDKTNFVDDLFNSDLANKYPNSILRINRINYPFDKSFNLPLIQGCFRDIIKIDKPLIRKELEQQVLEIHEPNINLCGIVEKYTERFVDEFLSWSVLLKFSEPSVININDKELTIKTTNNNYNKVFTPFKPNSVKNMKTSRMHSKG